MKLAVEKSKEIAMKSTKDLRVFLVEQMEGVASGDLDINSAKGISNLSQQIYNTLNIEIKLASAKARLGDALTVAAVEFDG